MRQLALLAVVLLATVPTLGRLAPTPLRAGADSPAMHHVAAPAHDMSVPMHGMQMHHMPVHDMSMDRMHAMPMDEAVMPQAQSSGHLPPAAPPANHDQAGNGPHAGHDGDCNYCPLLHSLLGALAIAPFAMPEGALPPPQVREVAATLPWHYPTGLGSRGPPATL